MFESTRETHNVKKVFLLWHIANLRKSGLSKLKWDNLTDPNIKWYMFPIYVMVVFCLMGKHGVQIKLTINSNILKVW